MNAAAMPVYVINMPSAAQRRRRMQAALQAVGLQAEWVQAVVGRELDAQTLDALYAPRLNRRQFYRPLTPGEIGCYASHLKVWQLMVQRGQPCALVLEDDVALEPALPAVLQALALRADWDMVKLVGRDNEAPAQRLPLAGGAELVRYRRVPSLTGAYAISLEGARKLTQRLPPFGRPVDVDLRHHWEFGLRMFGALPYPARLNEDSLVSTIDGRNAPGLSLVPRLRKLRYQLRYSWYNHFFSRRSS
ncbi:glycosyltransferase family 25 protein [Azohydromonas lata]|uniref:Glycosyltransferase family 25 protein n=1 Tax=Azohydromonas lata TaxID=45677 RepID=A0ABU5IJJ7_9BURK|nr:glycosyltransferase family 25 protein [Azohydromonas lata]MDZ5459072.1 glycosyltransferase family 25 protein [Azohydromonas lata]